MDIKFIESVREIVKSLQHEQLHQTPRWYEDKLEHLDYQAEEFKKTVPTYSRLITKEVADLHVLLSQCRDTSNTKNSSIDNEYYAKQVGHVLWDLIYHRLIDLAWIDNEEFEKCLPFARQYVANAQTDSETEQFVIRKVKRLIEDGDKPKSQQLSLKQIALIHAIEGRAISNDNANKVAMRHGYRSGKKLKQHYDSYSRTSERIGDPGTEIKLKNKVRLYESIMPFLREEFMAKAGEELETLKSKLLNK